MSSTPAIPHRIRWAVAQLDIRPADRVLEIGCGRGVAAALVCDRLTDGTFLGMDRSASAVKGAEARNSAHIAAGRARFALDAIEGADLSGDAPFDKVFAINVNLFWTRDPGHELDLIRGVLAADGALHLFYEAPSPDQLPQLGEKLAKTLTANDYTATSGLDAGGTVLEVVGHPGKAA